MTDRSDSPLAEIVLPGAPLTETIAFFTDHLGFRLETIFPADHPRIAVLIGFGLRLRFDRQYRGDAGKLRLAYPKPPRDASVTASSRAPNGTEIEIVPAENAGMVKLPPATPSWVISRRCETESWIVGRAGMHYRDLVPDRQGGRFIVSHIRIADGGPVPDYVHFHRVRVQWIYCYRGWVKVVYEDQGPPFVLQAGDFVLQPPQIRHRVLECSDGLEVIELGSPAEHETGVDHDLTLPTPTRRPAREFTGQTFVRHQADRATWTACAVEGFEARDLGIATATKGLAHVEVIRRGSGELPGPLRHDAEFLFYFVLQGTVVTMLNGQPEKLRAGDSFAVPTGGEYQFCDAAENLEMLVAQLPANRDPRPVERQT